MNEIKLNDVLRIDDLTNVKIRFLKELDNSDWNPIESFKGNDMEELLKGQYWNFSRKSFSEGQTTLGFVRIENGGNLWLLFHIGKITKDLNILNNGPAYEFETLADFEKYFGRLIIKFKNTAQNMIRNADTVMDACEVAQILPDIFDNDIFPGYDKVNISWEELARVLDKDTWKTALQNQKGVYLITDISNGKNYIGSAYGENMILGRWSSYIRTGHGGNIGLKELSFDYIKKNFRYSILDIYKSKVQDDVILERENWWKNALKSREFGYNDN